MKRIVKRPLHEEEPVLVSRARFVEPRFDGAIVRLTSHAITKRGEFCSPEAQKFLEHLRRVGGVVKRDADEDVHAGPNGRGVTGRVASGVGGRDGDAMHVVRGFKSSTVGTGLETASGGGVARAEASKGRGSLGQRKGGGAGERVGDGHGERVRGSGRGGVGVGGGGGGGGRGVGVGVDVDVGVGVGSTSGSTSGSGSASTALRL